MAEKDESELHTQINMLAPISRLPQELLERVFLTYVHLARSLFTNRRYTANGDEELSSSAWEKITRVCRHWKVVSEGYPALWTWIAPDLDSQDTATFTRRALTKSGMHPPTVYNHHFETEPLPLFPDPVYAYIDFRDDSVFLLLSQLSRIRCLQLSIPQGVYNFLASGAIRALDAPLLEDLFLILGSLQPGSVNVPALSSLALPSLRSLTVMYGTRRIIETFTRATLTSLTIRRPSPRVPTTTLVHLLQDLLGKFTLAGKVPEMSLCIIAAFLNHVVQCHSDDALSSSGLICEPLCHDLCSEPPTSQA